MILINSPCENCNNRKTNCHNDCKDYKLYKFKKLYYTKRNNKVDDRVNYVSATRIYADHNKGKIMRKAR